MRLLGKTAIVTGGGSGIGEAIVRRFVTEGAAVMIVDRDAAGAERVRASVAAARPDCAIATLIADIADPETGARLVAACDATIGRPNVLVNNAGVNVFGDPLATDDDAWDRCLAIDLTGAWRCCRAVLPGMVAVRGAIINISSIHALQVMPDTFPYPVAKHGLIGLTRSLAIQYAGHGVTVNAISPGYVDTPINERYFATFDDPAAARRSAEEGIPAKRLGRPDEIAAIAVLLASDEARFVCGANIVVDGGVSIRM